MKRPPKECARAQIFPFIFFVAALLSTLSASSQNITKAEYFFNTDPGFGLGTDVPVIPSPNISNLQFSIGLGSLPYGFHTLFIRAKDANDRWSLSNVKAFYKSELNATILPDITKAEYFMDADPGFGLGTNIPVTPSPNISNLQFTIGLGIVTNGFHTLFIRAKDGNGRWSFSQVNGYYKLALNPVILPDVTKVEYFLDSDPGFGSGTNIPVVPSSNISSLQFSIGLGAVPAGFHMLYVRAKDGNGRWSLSQVKSFYNLALGSISLPNVTKAEYFMDTDPGFGLGSNIPVSPSTNISNLQFSIDLGTVSTGFHTLFVRAKDGNGHWSITQVKSFYKAPVYPPVMPDVTKAEYFIDTDPGFGSGTNIPVSPSNNISNLQFVIDLNAVPVGFHTLFVRAKDGNGRWSFTQVKAFYKTGGTPVLPDVTKVEYFFDADPGMGLGTNVPVTPTTNISNLGFTIDLSALPLGEHVLWVRARDGDGKWSLANWGVFNQLNLSAGVTIVASNNPVCAGTPVTFTATPANGGSAPAYQWKVNGVNVGLNSAAFSYTPANADTVACVMTSNLPNVVGNPANSNQVIMSALVLNATITGMTSTCAGPSSVVYATESGMNGYNWTVSAGGQIVSGNGTSSINVIWSTAGAKTVSVTYGNGGCVTPNPGLLNVTVYGVPGVAGIISGPAKVCLGTQGVAYSVSSIQGATSYQWTVPAGITIASGAGTNSILVNYAASVFSGTISVNGTNLCGNGAQSPGLSIASNASLTGQSDLTNITVSSNQKFCEAAQIITTAGGGTSFVIENRGEATLIASQSVRLLPGTTVNHGGTLHASITTQCTGCGLTKNSYSDSSRLNDKDNRGGISIDPSGSSIHVYPNPTTGSFILELLHKTGNDHILVEIYNAQGKKLSTENLTNEVRHVFSLSDRPVGIYFLRVINGEGVETIKVIRH